MNFTIYRTLLTLHQTWKRDTIPIGAGQLILENIKLNNVPVAITGYGSTILQGGTLTIDAWGQGNKYSPNGPEKFQGLFNAFARPEGLLENGEYYSKSKPQYENLSQGDFISARGEGATGNGNTDDTTAIQNAINKGAQQNKVVFFEHGKHTIQTNEIPD
jgi:glucan 1,3-beta-glucosidase